MCKKHNILSDDTPVHRRKKQGNCGRIVYKITFFILFSSAIDCNLANGICSPLISGIIDFV